MVLKSNALIESLECAIILVDQDSNVERVNISTETLFCQSRRYLIGQKLSELVPDSAVLKCVEECKVDQSQFTLRESVLDISGTESIVDMTLSCVTNADGVAPSILIEINSINRISRFMREKNQLERQQSFRLMMRGLAHEI